MKGQVSENPEWNWHRLAQIGDADGARENLYRALEMDPCPEVQAAKAELARLESD